jgi:hypothetical protein
MVGVMDVIFVFVNVLCKLNVVQIVGFVGRGTTHPQVGLVTNGRDLGLYCFLLLVDSFGIKPSLKRKEKSILHQRGNTICYHVKLPFARRLFNRTSTA